LKRLLTSAITAGGNIAMTGTNVGIDASTVAADGKLDVMAYNDLSITAGMENSSYSYQSSSGGGGFFGKKKSESLDESHLTYQESVLSSGDDMSLNAMGNIGIAGSEVESGGDIDITAFGGLTITSLQEQHHREHKVEKTGRFGGLFGGSSSRTEISSLTEIKGTEITSIADLTTQSGSDTTIRASRVSAGGDLNISVGKGPFADPDAKLWLLTDKERDYLSVSEYEGGTLKWTMTEYGHEKEVVRHAILESGGDFIIESPGGVVVEYRSTGDFATDIAQLAEAPGLEYLADLQGMDNVDWQGVEEIYRTWYDQSSGLGGGAMAIIAIATAIITAGATAALSASLSGLQSGLTAAQIAAVEAAGMTSQIIQGVTYWGTATQFTAMAMVNAALASVAVTASTSIANGAASGDMRGAFQSIFSSDSLRSIVAAALTAGALHNVGTVDVGNAFGNDTLNTVATRIVNNGIRSVVSSSINSVATGTDLGEVLESGLVSAAVSAVSSVGYEYVGGYAEQAGIPEGDIRKVLSHAVIGGLSAEISGSDFRTGAIAAAMTELSSSTVGGISDDPEMRVRLAGLIGGVASAIAGGDGNDVTIAANIAQTIRTFNHELHPAAESEVQRVLAKAKQQGTASDDLSEEDILEVMEAMAGSHVRYIDDGVELDLTGLSPEAVSFVRRHSILVDFIVTDGNENAGIGKGIVNGAIPLADVFEYDNSEQQEWGEGSEIIGGLITGGGVYKVGTKLIAWGGKFFLKSGDDFLNGSGAKFADDAKLQDHYVRHGNDFGAKNAKQYQYQADKFLTSPRGSNTLEKTRLNGDIVRYNTKTQEFGVISKNGNIRTYYKPNPSVHGKPTNLDYFNAQ